MSGREVAVKAYRGVIRFCFVAADIEDAGAIHESIDDVVGGYAFVEGGSCEEMDAADVVPGSPLDLALREAHPAEGALSVGRGDKEQA